MEIDSGASESLGLGTGAEAARESGEQYREQAKKAQAQLQRVKKDEKKSQGDNDKLFDLLQKFIQDPYYQDLIPRLSQLLAISTPSRGIMALLGLFYPDAAYYMTYVTDKMEKIQIMISLHRSDTLVDFDENTLDPTIREWITQWVSLMEKFLFHPDASVVMNKKFLQYLETSHRGFFRDTIAEFFIFFFATRNIRMSQKTGNDYASFIQENLIAATKRHLNTHAEDPLLHDTELTSDTIFGIE